MTTTLFANFKTDRQQENVQPKRRVLFAKCMARIYLVSYVHTQQSVFSKSPRLLYRLSEMCWWERMEMPLAEEFRACVAYCIGELGSPFALSPPRDVRKRFSLCRRLQNHTLTTSFSRWRESATLLISLDEGLGCVWKWRSSASLAATPIVVRRLRRRSGDCSSSWWTAPAFSASSNHFSKIGFSFCAFL